MLIEKILLRVWDENEKVKASLVPVVSQNFSIDDIKGSYKWVSIYIEFQSYAVLHLLPVAEENLNYYCKCIDGEE